MFNKQFGTGGRVQQSLSGFAGAVAFVGLTIAGQAGAADLEKVVFGTNWYAQAEHGGFYQAQAEGIYDKHGLDVSIEMGGPQVNGTQLLVAGRRNFSMGYPIGDINAVLEGLPVVTVAAAFQSDPQEACRCGHPLPAPR